MRYRDRFTRGVSLERGYELALAGDESDAIEEARTTRVERTHRVGDPCLSCGRMSAYETCQACEADDRRRGIHVW